MLSDACSTLMYTRRSGSCPAKNRIFGDVSDELLHATGATRENALTLIGIYFGVQLHLPRAHLSYQTYTLVTMPILH